VSSLSGQIALSDMSGDEECVGKTYILLKDLGIKNFDRLSAGRNGPKRHKQVVQRTSYLAAS
jgi:hypothetical protein